MVAYKWHLEWHLRRLLLWARRGPAWLSQRGCWALDLLPAGAALAGIVPLR